MKVLIHYNRSLPSHVLSSRLKYLKLRFNFYRVLGILSNIDRIDYMQKNKRCGNHVNTKKCCWTSTIVIIRCRHGWRVWKIQRPFQQQQKKLFINNIYMRYIKETPLYSRDLFDSGSNIQKISHKRHSS